jgi:hypothetical protein
MPHLTLLCVFCLTGTTLGINRISANVSNSVSSAELSGDVLDADAVLGHTAKVLQIARGSRLSKRPKHATPPTSPLGGGMKIARMANDYFNLFRNGEFPKIVTSKETKEWFKGIGKRVHKAKEGRSVTDLKMSTGDIGLMIGFIVDAIDFAMLVVTAFFPNIAWASELFVFFTWWASGLTVYMTEGNFTFIDSLYGLMQVPTSIGFGDILPSEEQYGLKLFYTAHAFISSVFMTGRMNWYVDWVLNQVDKILKAKTHFQKLITAMIEIIIECTFSTLYFGYSFHRTSDQSADLDIVDAFYMTVIALTSVGYGDFSPQTQLDRMFGFFWGHFGTATAARFLDEWSEVRNYRKPRVLNIVDKKTFENHSIVTDMTMKELEEAVTITTTLA